MLKSRVLVLLGLAFTGCLNLNKFPICDGPDADQSACMGGNGPAADRTGGANGSSSGSGGQPNAGGKPGDGGDSGSGGRESTGGSVAGAAGSRGMGGDGGSQGPLGMDAPVDVTSPPAACNQSTPPVCDGTSIKECQNDGTLRTSPCERGCAGAVCCGPNTESQAGSCAACGADGQACCKLATPPCAGTLQCVGEKCVVSCGDAPGQRCCEGNTTPCMNNCGTPGGTKTCKGGSYGSCSLGDTCCGDPSCSNNCGEKGTRPCSGTSLGACPVSNKDCCPGDTKKCSNSCNTATGTIACKNGRFSDADCSVKNSPCPGEKGQKCKNGGCDSGLYCSSADKCEAQKGQRADCSEQKECKDNLVCNLDENRCCPKTCPANQHCLNGDCKKEDGQPCSSGGDCTSEVCAKPDPNNPGKLLCGRA
jgi:hypothetical protein